MLSVNTNYSAMVALQNLNYTNTQLEGVQNRISTGMKVSTAKDNGAVYAIAEGQRARVSAVSAVQDGISRASSTIDVALSAGDKIGKVIQELKAKAVAAQANDLTTEQRAALQADFAALRSQIDSIANSSQFNGANLIKGTGNDLNVLISDLGGSVAATGTGIQSAAPATILSGSALVTSTGAVTDTDVETFALTGGPGAFSFGVTITATMTVDDFVNAVNTGSGGKISASYDDQTGQFTYLINDADYTGMTITHTDTDTSTDTGVALGATVASGTVTSAGSNVYTVTGRDWSMAGALFATFASADISTSAASAGTAATQLETALTALNEQMASMGSQSKALDIQSDFLGKLSDSIEAGIGNLVDADLAKESAKLQSLQIKQQLGAQALSIANQAPSVIMNLFRG